jgi:putative Mn2+ efflux pump MntP
LEIHLHHDLIVLTKTFGVALAVGLDALAVSVGVGVTQIALKARYRLGRAFAGSEITMQVVAIDSARVRAEFWAKSPHIWALRCSAWSVHNP